jgi:cell division protein FtsN
VAVALQGLIDLLTPEKSRYALQVGQFEHADLAEPLATRVRAVGLPCAVLRMVDKGGRSWSVVAAGDFKTVDEARAARVAFAQRLGLLEPLPVIAL